MCIPYISCVCYSEAGLYTTVLDCGGETHFDPYHTNPLKYASVLLACHRFGDAVLYLWNSNKPLPAIHIMLLCLYYGLILPCVPLTQNPPFRHASLLAPSVGRGERGSERGSGGEMSGSGNSQLSPANILLYYFNEHIQQTIPEICLDYIMYLQPIHWNTNTLQRELSYDIYSNVYSNILTNNNKLIISIIEKFLIILPKNMLTRIVGVPFTPETTTINTGYLYQYFDRVTINRYLHHIAYHLLTEKQEIEAAIYFYQLCGMYIDAMDIISKQLCKFVTSKLTSEREHWINIATIFYETYIHTDNGQFLLSSEKNSLSNLTSNPPSDVTTLTSTPSDQLNTFLTLLNISLLVTHVYKHEYADAYTVLNEINILPPTSKDVNKYIQILNTIPPLSNTTTTTTRTTTSSSSYILYLIDDLLLISMDVYINMIALLQQQASSVMCSNIQRNDIKYHVGKIVLCSIIYFVYIVLYVCIVCL